MLRLNEHGTSPVSGSGGPASVGAGALICARSPLAVFVRAHASAQRRAVPVTNGARAHCRRRSYTQHQRPAPLSQHSFLHRQRLLDIRPRAPAIQPYYMEIRNFVIIFIQYLYYLVFCDNIRTFFHFHLSYYVIWQYGIWLELLMVRDDT